MKTKTIELLKPDYGAEIRAEMARQQLKQQSISQLTGISTATISKIMNSDTEVSLEKVLTVAKVFGIDVWQKNIDRIKETK